MKKSISVVVVGLLVLVAAVSVSSAPRLTIDNPVFKFGYVPQFSKVTHNFWLHSTGDDTLRIIKVVPG